MEPNASAHLSLPLGLLRSRRRRRLARPTPEQRRATLDLIIDRTAQLHTNSFPEVLTVDNHCDGPYLYLRMQREGNPAPTKNGAAAHERRHRRPRHRLCQLGRHRLPRSVLAQPTGWQRAANPFSKSGRAAPGSLLQLRTKKRRVTGRCENCRFRCLRQLPRALKPPATSGASIRLCLTDEEIAPAAHERASTHRPAPPTRPPQRPG